MIAKQEKKKLFIKSITKLKYALKSKTKSDQELSLLKSIFSIEKNVERINYKDSFMLLMNLSNQYRDSLTAISNGDFKQEMLEDEGFWDGEIKLPTDEVINYCSFYIYRYLIEMNPDIVYDFKQIEGLSSEQIKNFIRQM